MYVRDSFDDENGKNYRVSDECIHEELHVYPIVAVGYKLGYLISAGINLDNDPYGNALEIIGSSIDMLVGRVMLMG